MLKIKLSRVGKKNQAQYRIVVAEARSKRDGKYSDNLGYYKPSLDPSVLEIDKDKYDYWLSKGAQPTKTVKQIIEKYS